MDRSFWIQKRQALSKAQRREKEKAIVNKLLPFLKGNVGAYVPVRGEVDIFTSLRSYNHLYLPRVTGPSTMEFVPYCKDLVEGAFHVLEPLGDPCDPMELDVILVPMVSFCGLSRAGYGKGYYDRYLMKTNAFKIGIAFDVQEGIFLKKEHDVDMDLLITETKILEEDK